MCILFFYIARQVSAKSHNSTSSKKYKFILAANRDELYTRPSKFAEFWVSDPNILAGQDMESEGTWLGINKNTGRLAALTNIMGGTVRDPSRPKISRGEIITDFLRSSSTLSGLEYCKKLSQDPNILDKFNKFNLITVDFPDTKSRSISHNEKLNKVSDNANFPSVVYFTNSTTKSSPILLDQETFFGVSNSIYSNPFQKVIKGCKEFQTILEKHDAVIEKHLPSESEEKRRENLIEDLLHFLRNEDINLPDTQMEKQAKEKNIKLVPSLSSIYVCTPRAMYGTRTHTMLFLDSDNQTEFHEWSMNETIDPERPTWHKSSYKFQLFS